LKKKKKKQDEGGIIQLQLSRTEYCWCETYNAIQNNFDY